MNFFKLFVCVFFILFSLNGFNQKELNQDSIINVINKEKSIDEKIKIYTENCRPLLVTINRNEILSFNEALLKKINLREKGLFEFETDLLEAKVLAYMNKNDLAEISLKKILNPSNEQYVATYAKSIEMIGLLYINIGDANKALKQIDDYLSTSKRKLTNNQLSGMLCVKGTAYQQMGYLNLSVKEIILADSLLSNDDRSRLYYYHTLAENFGRLKDLEAAEKYLKKAYQLGLNIEDKFSLNMTKIQLGILYQEQKEYAKSDSILKLAKAYFQENYNPINIFNINDLLSINNYLTNNYLESIQGYKASLNDELSHNSHGHTETHNNIALNYIGLKKPNAAKLYLDTAFSYWDKNINSNNYLRLLETKGKLAKLNNDFEGAFYALLEHDSLDKIRREQADLTKANELKYLYDSEKKEKENIVLKSKNSEIEEDKQKQFYQLLIGILFLTLGLIVLYLLFKNKQKKNEKLKELDTLKSKFFESISHELRTPLTLIQLPVSKALENEQPISKKNLKTIKYNAKRLQNLMDDLLSITRIEANKYPLLITENNITEQASVLAAQFDSLAESNGIKYIKNIEPKRIIGKYDKEVFNKVLINLISNAIKYSLDKGKVIVNFEVKNSSALLTISDQGMGIKKEDQQYIFDKFYRVDQNNENIPGSGIGLSIVKELIEIIGGSISFESELGKGTQFLVQFPIEEIHNEETVVNDNYISTHKTVVSAEEIDLELEEELAIINADKPHLLVVEDNQELLTYVKEQLSEDYKVFTANNGKLGIEKGLEIVPDLIISDWLMPEKNGIELCGAIKQNEITSHIPVIMLTAKTEVEDKVKGFETGADAYVAKPFEMNVLKAQIKNIITQRQLLLDKYNKGESFNPAKNFSERDLKFWNKMKNLVEENMANSDFSVSTLADELFVSRMQLNRKVKALINLSGSEYITSQKMKLAKMLLKNKDLQISEVAFKVGYDNVNSFSRAFKKEMEQSPSEFRKKLD